MSLAEAAPGRVVVIGLDGTPFSFAQEMMGRGELPNLARLAKDGSLVRTTSVLPALSAVAWASFMTGKNPGGHNIYGFLDRRPHSYDTYIPSRATMGGDTLWEILTRTGKRVVAINVPMTYPLRPVNGIMVSGFMSPSLAVATYPTSVAKTLEGLGYVIDVDTWRAREDMDGFLEDLRRALRARATAFFHFLEKEEWDFLMLHIMETDRLHHFLWEHMERGDPTYYPEFLDFYREVDCFLGAAYERVRDRATLMVMSDHGFCTLKKEVYISYWLAERGWLRYRVKRPASLADIDSSSRAYSLDAGRIYINLRGREPAGSIQPGAEYEALRVSIAQGLGELEDPESGERMIEQVLKREEAYSGPALLNAPDLVAIPRNGYDLKAGFDKSALTGKGAVVGMHTYDDALLYVSGCQVLEASPSVMDVMPTILKLMGVGVPGDLDGVALV